MSFVMKDDEALDVLNIGFLGAEAEVSEARCDPNLVKEFGL
jgi:hypothetical protein